MRATTAMTLALLVASTSSLIAQVAAPADAAADKELMQKLYKESQAIAEAGSFYRLDSGKRVSVPLQKEPIYRHHDAARNEQGGGIWLIGEDGRRPMAMTVLYTSPIRSTWVQSIRSLTPSKDIGGDMKEGNRWRPNQPGLDFKPLPKAPKPSNSPKIRFSQLKQQARRFSGHEFWRDQRHELRLIPKELHKYEDEKESVELGAVFSIAHNNNAETYLVIEVRESKDGLEWWYALGRFGFAELHINIDGKEVWQRPELRNGTSSIDPYHLFHVRKNTVSPGVLQ